MEIPRQFEHLDFHVSPKENRKSIEEKGLEPRNYSGGILEDDDEGNDDYKPAIYVSSLPREEFGDDIWGINNPVEGTQPKMWGQTNRRYETFMNSVGDYAISEPVPISDIKRVGHIYRTDNGHPEVHWHKEEDCPDVSK